MRLGMMKGIYAAVIMVGVLAGTSAGSETAGLEPKKGFDMKKVERGRYIITIGACNDCHTPGYLVSEGKTPVSQWLTGDQLGWRGPWGTTYPKNLRIFVNGLTEDQWVSTAKTLRRRPPMPWFNVNAIHEEDLRAVYQFIRYLGPAGEPAPAPLPPDQEPKGPFVLFPAPPN